MKKQFGLVILFSLLLVSSVFGAYSYYDSSLGGFGGGDLSMMFNDFIDLITENEYLVDAVVFLIVFLILVKKALPAQYAEDKALYVVIAIALTIGIMVYERRTGVSLVINSGWLGLILLLVFGAYLASASGDFTPMRLIILASLVLVAGYIIPPLFSNYQYVIQDNILYSLIMLISGGSIVYGLVWLLFYKGGNNK